MWQAWLNSADSNFTSEPSTDQVCTVRFHQSQQQVVAEGSRGLHIECSHDDSTLTVMLWYQQRGDGPLTLIGYGYETLPNYEADFEKEFKMTRQSAVKGTLEVSSARASHSAVYFCAASTQ